MYTWVKIKIAFTIYRCKNIYMGISKTKSSEKSLPDIVQSDWYLLIKK